jgi:hypothetical protein
MKLEDLKFGMVCRLRNKGEIVILDDGSYYYELYKHRNYIINNYNKDFKHKQHDYFDIMEVSFGNEIIFKRKESRWFVPEDGEKYYFLDSYGEVIEYINQQGVYDKGIFNYQRVFKTQEEAFKRLKEQQATLSVERWIAENDVEVDIYDNDKTKYYIVYDIERKELRVDYYNHYITAPKQFILSSGKKAEELIKEREKELKIMFGVEE